VASRFQSFPERSGVLDDPVVYDGNVSLAVDVGVGVALIGNAVRRPARMPDSQIALNRTAHECPLQLRDLAGGLAGLDARSIHDGHAG
jgi:hypothetical protein